MTTSNEDQPPKRRPGRQPSGKTREEIERLSQKHTRDKKNDAGLVTLRVFINMETRISLHELRDKLGANDLGHTLDILTKSPEFRALVEKQKKYNI